MTKELAGYLLLVDDLREKNEHQSIMLKLKTEEFEKQGRVLADFRRANQDYDRAHKKLNSQLAEKSRQIKKLEGRLSQQQGQIEGWQKNSDDFAAKVQKLNNQLEQANAKAEQAKAELKGFQLDAMEKAQNGWPAVEDSKVRDALQGLFAKVRAWSKKYSVSSMTVPLQRFAPDFLSTVADFPEDEALVNLKYPHLILAALVSEHLRLGVFANPFFVLSHIENEKDMPQRGEHLNDVFQKLLKVNEPEAHQFRIQVLRHFFPESQLDQLGQHSSLVKWETPKKLLTDNTMSFFSSFAAFIRIDDDSWQPCYEGLFQIVAAAAAINNHLATQRIWYVWRGPSPLLGQPFAVSSEYARADRYNKLNDDEDTKCDGKPIRITLSPVLFAYGNSDGKDYDKHRVVVKASVWIDDLTVAEEL
ncbi:hypothetical protein IWZ01DRAFT_541391 [Phyllosticta capitalensis]